MLKYAVLILWRKKGVAANFYAFCISAWRSPQVPLCLVGHHLESCLGGIWVSDFVKCLPNGWNFEWTGITKVNVCISPVLDSVLENLKADLEPVCCWCFFTAPAIELYEIFRKKYFCRHRKRIRIFLYTSYTSPSILRRPFHTYCYVCGFNSRTDASHTAWMGPPAQLSRSVRWVF